MTIVELVRAKRPILSLAAMCALRGAVHATADLADSVQIGRRNHARQDGARRPGKASGAPS
jgi:hypothetical protein